MKRAGQIIRTVRHLRPVQWVGRARRAATSALDRREPPWWVARVARGRDVALRPGWRPAWPAWAPLSALPVLGESAPRALGTALPEGWADQDLDGLGLSPLATVHLHAFHFAGDPSAMRAAMDAWAAHNPPPRQPGWSPWCVARRVPVWLRVLSAPAAPGDTEGDAAGDAARVALVGAQLQALVDRLERDLQGNHLWDDAVALCMAEAALVGPPVAAWGALGRRLLHEAFERQLLPSGAHAERSMMYHATLLAGLLDLLAAQEAADGADPVVRRAAEAMARWLAAATPRCGRLALHNDAAEGLSPTPHAVLAEAERAGLVPPMARRAPLARDLDGLLVIRQGGHHLAFDAAPVGLDEQPGHAHADTLGFEWLVGDTPVVVDPGVAEYVADPHRAWCRGSAAHGVLQLDGADSAEVWHTFRVGRRPASVRAAGPSPVAVPTGRGWRMWGRHDGFRALPGAPEVERAALLWLIDDTRAVLLLEDRVDGPYAEATSRLPLGLGVVAQVDQAGSANTASPGGLSGALSGVVAGRWCAFGVGAVAVAPGRVSAGFGDWRSAQVLVGSGARRRSGWALAVGAGLTLDWRDGAVQVSVDGAAVGSWRPGAEVVRGL